MWRRKNKTAAKREVATLRLPDVTPEIRLAMSWTPPGGHKVISKAKAKPKVKAKASGSGGKKKVAHSRSAKTKAKASGSGGKKKVVHSRSAKTKAKGQRSRTSVAV